MYPVPYPRANLQIAAFLQSDPRLDKAKIGEYIGGPKHIPVLEAFVKSFDFRAAHIEDALRQFLAAFRLPGEAQIIQRILELFGAHWFASYEGERVVASADVAFVLSYAIIILNVDLHNPKNKNRMQLKDFLRNHRGLNANADFPPAFLEKIYKSIAAHEIVMPEEQKGELKEDYDWQVCFFLIVIILLVVIFYFFVPCNLLPVIFAHGRSSLPVDATPPWAQL